MPRVGGLRLNLLVFVALMYVLLLHRFRSVVRNITTLFLWPVAALAAYCFWAFLSLAWSPVPSESAAQAGLLAGALVLAVSYADIPVVHLAREFARVATFVALISWLLLVIAPNVAVQPDVTWRLNGAMGHEQRLALVVGAAIVLWVALRLNGTRVFKSQALDVFALVLLGATLLATQTRANTVYVLVVVGALVYLRTRPPVKVLLLSVFAAFVVWLTLNFNDVMASLEREGSNTATLTGRTTIWEGALAMVPAHPWEGYGYGSFYSPLTAHFFANYIAPHAHNTWINALFETGIIGVTLLSMFLLGGLAAGHVSKSNLYAWPIVLFVCLCGLTGVVFGEKLSTLWIIAAAMVAQVAWQRRNAPRRVHLRTKGAGRSRTASGGVSATRRSARHSK